MNNLMHNVVALKALEVSVTNTWQPSTAHNVTTVWLLMTAKEREVAVGLADECAGAVYFNSNKELVPFTIILRPCVQKDQAEWLIYQQGNHQHKGQAAVKLGSPISADWC